MRRQTLTLLGSFVLGIVASQASATTVTYTFTGTVYTESDGLGIFGGNYVGQSFKDVETFNLADASTSSPYAGDTIYEGGSANGEPTFGESMLTVGDTPGSQYMTTIYGTQNASVRIDDNTSLNTQIIPYGFYSYGGAYPEGTNTAELDESFNGPVGDGMTPETVMNTGMPPYTIGAYIVEEGSAGTSSFEFDNSELVISVGSGPSTVPLPASAPLFGGALATLGILGLGRKRRKAVTSA